jgi:hypothetical protein
MEQTSNNKCTYCGKESEELIQHLGTCQPESWTCEQCFGEHGGYIMQVQQDLQDLSDGILGGGVDDFEHVVKIIANMAKVLQDEDLPAYLKAIEARDKREAGQQ